VTVIIDYDAGNLRSVQRACHEVGVDAEITGDPDHLRGADRIIFPGVGAAGAAMRSLRANGMDEALREAIRAGVPVFGICLGMQISLDHSEENDQQTLGLIPGEVRRFAFERPELKIPHMGWNEVRVVKPHPLLRDVQPGDEFYFVHGYYPEPRRSEDVYAVTDYEVDFACALGRDNYFGMQCHPEKSGRVGLKVLKRFLGWNGTC
jgi:imidazole glycerol-phosphate synthase subunit HisH